MVLVLFLTLGPELWPFGFQKGIHPISELLAPGTSDLHSFKVPRSLSLSLLAEVVTEAKQKAEPLSSGPRPLRVSLTSPKTTD